MGALPSSFFFKKIICIFQFCLPNLRDKNIQYETALMSLKKQKGAGEIKSKVGTGARTSFLQTQEGGAGHLARW